MLIALIAIQSCSVKKYIPADENLFRGGNVTVRDTIKIEDKSGLENELQDLLYPEPNTKILGLYPGLSIHYKAQKEKPGFIIRFLNKKLGEEPVYFSDVNLAKTEDLIENRLVNSGYFESKISSTIQKDSSSKTVKTNYSVVVGQPYRLKDYVIEIDSVDLSDSLPVYAEIRKSLSETILKKGNRYDLTAFKNERDRIDQYLKNQGYYNFNPDFILFQADTNLLDNRQYNLYLKLQTGVPAKSKVPYLLNKVEVYSFVTNDTTAIPQDTITLDEVAFIQYNVFFKPKHLRPFILLKPGQFYNPLKSKYTSQRISSIGTYKYININYKEIDTLGIDTLEVRYLNAIISLSPLTKKSIRAELQGVTKSNNFTGPNVGLTYLNRNAFNGGENFSATGSFGYEKQFGNKTNGSNSLQLGMNLALIYPRLIFPGNLDKYFKYAIPKTKMSVGFEYYRRSKLYTLNSYNASFGYIWNANRRVSHLVTPINLNYIRLVNTTSQFDSILDTNPFLKRSFEQQFIAGLTYSFHYSELNDAQKKGKFNFIFTFDIAGNAISLLGTKGESDTAKSFLSLPYAQYVKGDIDLSYHYDIGKKGQSIVGHIFAGIGIPYGNSQTLPYVKQYFSGGSYSVRAFQIRGLGPGIYDPVENSNLNFDRSGDIRLEGNLEYRFPIISVLKGALFVDAGNIWNINNNVAGGQFTSDFIQQFGIGAGFGLRIDVQGFVIRFDLAAPLKTPAGGWEFDYKNPVFNFAIGYPF
ncbi:translocation and assembly module lipoprotein TamL [Crocinitomix catalasitica]|uniref:translocation and assembly module lipoprotein TamL n=1 Tax=Crocinitomix catalasitica TaxID=184607 RepID=UPI001FDF6248|nr:BamA/TamA family outer membrane protein [Crocinitomix catalasitica]